MANASDRFERLRGIAVVIMCVAVAGAAAKSLIPPAAPSERPEVMPPPPYLKGEQISPIGNLEPHDRTLLMVISPSCTFCTKSMPFYKQLASERDSGRSNVRLVALYLPMDNEESVTAYMRQFGVSANQILPFQREILGRLSGTPSLVLLDSRNTVLGSWKGMLTEDGEAEILRAIRS